MSETQNVVEGRDVSGKLLVALGIALVLSVAALIWCWGLTNHLSGAEAKLAAAEQKNVQLADQEQALAARLRATTETLGQSVGMTQKQIETKTQSILVAQQAQMAAVKAQSVQSAELAQKEAAAEKQIGSVQTDVSTVKTDVSGAKSSIAETQNDLAETRAQLQRTIGDAGVMSGLIATNHSELETLKHRGDRNYYEFTLVKGAQPTLLSTIKLQAKKVDQKKSKFTLLVSADDRNIEKKDKSLDEPVQFYTGKDPVLYEVVVNSISKNTISGYLSTPKSAGDAVPTPKS